jgi:hypothetical protein
MSSAVFPRRSAAAAVAAAGLWLSLLPSPVAADEPPRQPRNVSQERVDLFLAMLKRRAMQALEAHRAPPPEPWMTYGVDVVQGYESNVLLDGNKKGDHFTQEGLTVAVNPKLRQLPPWLAGEFTYELVNTHYTEIRDANLFMNTLGAALRVQPTPQVRGEAWYEFGDVDFPLDTSNSFADHRMGTRVRVAPWMGLTTTTGWAYLRRRYDTRKTRNGLGDDLEGVREDRRHALTQDVAYRWPGTSAKLALQVYRNASNDAFQDFYDWDDAQVQGVMTRLLHPRWIVVGVAGLERRNYRARSVPDLNVAERDTLSTLTASVIRLIGEHGQLAYSVTFRHQDSNDPRLDFHDWVNQVRFSANF